jgi:hypothetical protein
MTEEITLSLVHRWLHQGMFSRDIQPLCGHLRQDVANAEPVEDSSLIETIGVDRLMNDRSGMIGAIDVK